MSNIEELKFDDKNFNKHTEYGMSLLEKSLREFGAGRSVLVDKDNNIIAGNGIVESAINAGITKTKVVETTGDELVVVKRTDVELDSKKGRRMAFADNATSSADLEWDKDNIKSELSPEEVGEWGADISWDEVPEVEEDIPPEIDEEKVDSVEGRIYQLGEHRLMCGDSTRIDTVETLMGKARADLVITDPPYNVAVENSQGMTIQNDNMTTSEFSVFIDKAMQALSNSLKEGGSFYVWYGDSEDINFRQACFSNGLSIRQCLIWVKNSFNIGRQDYQWQHEPCLYGWKEGGTHYFVPKRNLATIMEQAQMPLEKMDKEQLIDIITSFRKVPTTIVRENKPRKDADHPTMKPIELLVRQIMNSSKKGDKVLDTFGGSGSTLIACQHTGRICYMMELDPHYCDVIRKRYWKLVTGDETGWQEGTKAQ